MRISKYFFLCLVFILSACQSLPPGNSDRKADERLQVEAGEEIERFREAAQDFQQSQIQEKQRQLERQITDPLAG